MPDKAPRRRLTPSTRVTRPPVVVLGSDTIVPERNLVKPAPNRFSHVVVDDEPFRYGDDTGAPPDGTLAKGTRVLLVNDQGDDVRVLAEDGLYVRVRTAALQPLP